MKVLRFADVIASGLRAMLIAMPVILLGLALALDVLGAASGLGASGQ